MRAGDHSVRIGGLRLHVRVSGPEDGPPLLLINGLGAHLDMWEPLLDVLGDDLRIVTFDAPGTGRSSTPPYPVTIPALAWLARSVLDRTGIERADVLGYSMGGLIAQQLAVSAPDRVRRLVLVGTSCGLGSVYGTLGPMLNIATPLRYWSKTFYRRTIAGMVGGRARHDAAWVERHGELRLRHPPTSEGYFGQVLTVSAWSGLPLLPRIRQPALVVTGDDDPLVPAANAMLLASRLGDARVLVAPGEGHLLLMDTESAVLEPIRDFVCAADLDAAPVWRDARVVGPREAQAAIAAARRQAQPWGAVGALLRTAWPAPRRVA
jgi:poly(3-hydroxyoctanoate) depolymerase